MNSAGVCSNCKERGHYAEKCPELWAPLKEGFYKGGGGGGGGGGGDDDEHVAAPEVYPLPKKDNGRNLFVHMGIPHNAHCRRIYCDVLQGEQVPCIPYKV